LVEYLTLDLGAGQVLDEVGSSLGVGCGVGDAEAYLMTHRIGILTGSLIAGIAGYLILKMAKPASQVAAEKPLAADDRQEWKEW